MSAGIPGHGGRYSFVIVPSCKCGWNGTQVGPGPYAQVFDRARSQFEVHKARHRNDSNGKPSKKKVKKPERHLALVK